MQGEYTYIRSFVCAGEVPAARFVTFDAAGKVALTAAQGEADGVSVDSGDTGEVISVALLGPAFVEVAGAVGAGRRVEAAADGRAVVVDEGEPLGVCLTEGLATAENVDRAEIFFKG